MTDNNDPRLFAFGKNSYNDFECPSIAAGRNPMRNDAAFYVATEYDRIVENTKDKSAGVVVERLARDIWLRVIEICEGRDEQEAATAAREIAAELDWL